LPICDSILGGFVAGRVSKKFEFLHGGIVGFIGILFGVLFWTTLPLWYIIVSLVGVVRLGMLGGRRKNAAPSIYFPHFTLMKCSLQYSPDYYIVIVYESISVQRKRLSILFPLK